MTTSLPSPPPHHSLPHTSLSIETVDVLRSSVGQTLVAIEELQGLLSWGGDAGIVGWPTLLSSYQRLLGLLSLLSHHINPPQPPTLPLPHSHPTSSVPAPRPPPLSYHLIHPHLPPDPAQPSQEAWLQSLLSLSASIHALPPVAPAIGTVAEFEERRQRAGRVCELLGGVESGRDWRGRVGLLPEEGATTTDVLGNPSQGTRDEGDSDGSEASSDEDASEEEDMFGSADEEAQEDKDTKAVAKETKKRKRVAEQETKVEKRRLFEGKGMTMKEREVELDRLMGFMRSGKR